ncbi:hypothetical protein GEMRC1_006020 [Eukaryota sp. GEM-RC1]
MIDISPCYVIRKAVDALGSYPAVLPVIPFEDLNFNIKIELGSGISGTVYLCKWADTSVALKLFCTSDQNEAKLLQEVSRMASLSHPFVIRVFGITRLPEHIGILMELGTGHLQVPTSLSPSTLAQAIEICSAVKYLHSKGIVHHDITPQNVILVNSQVKLADFGSARTMHYYTSTLEVAPKYTAPEAFRQIYGPAFDVYSLGILFYELFTNRLAFEGMRGVEVAMAKQKGFILRFPRDFPKPVSSLINKCLSVNLCERPSINDVLNELKDMQGNIEVFDLNSCLANDLQIEKRNDELAFEGYQEAAGRGDAKAMVYLGDCYYNGEGIREDHSKAVYWYKKAAKLGDSDAMNILGDCYYNGEGVREDHSKAVHWYKNAANLGDSDAMNNLGDCYYNGEGIREDHSKAVHWYKKAAKLGDSDAMNNLGDCYYNGEGVRENHSKAVYWYKKAADLGDSDAMYNLSLCYKNGHGVKKDQSQATYWYEKCVELDDSDASFEFRE